MSCNHIHDCLRCAGVLDESEDELARATARIAKLEHALEAAADLLMAADLVDDYPQLDKATDELRTRIEE